MPKRRDPGARPELDRSTEGVADRSAEQASPYPGVVGLELGSIEAHEPILPDRRCGDRQLQLTVRWYFAGHGRLCVFDLSAQSV